MSDTSHPLPGAGFASRPSGSRRTAGGLHFRSIDTEARKVISRRALLKAAGGVVALAAAGEVAVHEGGLRRLTGLKPVQMSTGNIREYTISASDGWISMPRHCLLYTSDAADE